MGRWNGRQHAFSSSVGNLTATAGGCRGDQPKERQAGIVRTVWAARRRRHKTCRDGRTPGRVAGSAGLPVFAQGKGMTTGPWVQAITIVPVTVGVTSSKFAGSG